MASRMERYYENNELTTGRSKKNKSLYDSIESLDSYTNIEGVASIENNNEIDISRVKKMINNRENYRKERELRTLLNEKEERIEQKEIPEEEEKNYDIKDILNKVKASNESGEYRKLDDENYKELKDIGKKPKKYIEVDPDELNELLKTIKVSEDAVNEISNEEGDLLDDLKSDTIVGDASSIKKIIDEEKEKQFESTETVENSLYTTNFGLTKKDFEDLKELNNQVSKSNTIMIVLMVMVIIAIIVFTIMLFV